jgi:hypothetical protein
LTSSVHVTISSVKRVEFVCGRLSCITVRGHWYDTVLSMNASTEDQTDDTKGSFFVELGRVFDTIPKYT